MNAAPAAAPAETGPEFDLAAPASLAVPALVVDVEGFEGPLDVLLTLARAQKVDLRRVQIVPLVDQFIAFVAAMPRLDLDLAADYLVMASWLAYLKSRLVLPQLEQPGQGPSGEELAARLAWRLQRLQAMREAGARLMARDRLERDVFLRGDPEGVTVLKRPAWADNLVDLLKSYAEQRTRKFGARLQLKRAPVYAIEDARRRLERLVGVSVDWTALEAFLPDVPAFAGLRASAVASMLMASLELVRDGEAEIRQLAPFEPVYLRRRERAEPVEQNAETPPLI